MRAINATNRTSAVDAAITKHPQLQSIFTARDSIIMQAGAIGNSGVLTDSVDDRIVDAILHDQVEAFSAMTAKNAGQHSVQHEAMNALI